MLISELRYVFHVIVRPFDGFWDLKHEKRGSLRTAMILLAAAVLTFLLVRRYTGFLFNRINVLYVNFFTEVIGFLLIYVLFITSNWCLTTLMDGKGTYRDIAVATAYALVPYILINTPLVALSNFITIEEGEFYYFFVTISYIWTGGLILIGTMVTHEYTMGKTILTLIFVVLGMVVMIFLGLLFFSVIQKMIGLVYVLYKEIKFRL